MTDDTTNFGTGRFYRRMPLALTYVNLPPDTPRWLVELEGTSPGFGPLRLEIAGETVIGRGRVGNLTIDLDMNEFNGAELGVSRRHAMLKPTADTLYLLDLGSLNGTQHNGLPLGPGITRPLLDGDAVTLGRLTFIVRVVEQPGGPAYETPPEPTYDESDSPPTPLVPFSGFQ